MSHSMLYPLVLLVGPADDFEFAEHRDWLSAHTRLLLADDMAAARRQILDDPPPELVVLLQPRPGAWNAAEVAALQRAVPGARWLLMLGSWCEGETRSGDPLEGVDRVFWHQGQPPLQWETASLRAGARLWQPSPREAEGMGEAPLCGRRRLLAIATPHLRDYEAFAALCAAEGWSTGWLPPRKPITLSQPAALLWDAVGTRPQELAHLRELREAFPHTPILALLHFPRWHEVELLQELGVAAVLGKPLAAGVLQAALAAHACPLETALRRAA